MPVLPTIIMKVISLFLFCGTMVLKILDMKTLFSVFDAPCIAGWEVSDQVANHLFMISLTIVPDVAFVILIGIALLVPSSNFGADPKAIAYNIFAAVLSYGSLIKISKLEDCRSEAMKIIHSAPFYATIAGILHAANGTLCVLVLPPEERRLPCSKKRTPPPGNE